MVAPSLWSHTDGQTQRGTTSECAVGIPHRRPRRRRRRERRRRSFSRTNTTTTPPRERRRQSFLEPAQHNTTQHARAAAAAEVVPRTNTTQHNNNNNNKKRNARPAEVLAHGDEVAQALEVLGVLGVDPLVVLERDRVVAHPPVARRDHQPPLDLVRLDLRRALEEVDRLLVELRLDVPHAEPRDHVERDRVVAVPFRGRWTDRQTDRPPPSRARRRRRSEAR